MSQSASSRFGQPVAAYESRALSLEPRLRIGLVIVILQWLIIKVPEWVVPQTMAQFMAMMWGPIIGTVALLIWWLAASRLPWPTRWAGLVAFIIGALIAVFLGHPTMHMALVMLVLPIVTTIWAIWAFVGARPGEKVLRAGLFVLLIGTWSSFALLRMDGLDGSIRSTLTWRWSETAEQRYLASLSPASQPVAVATSHPVELSLTPGDWPGFRGAARDGRVAGTTIRTDWSARPPEKLWGHRIGPGWGSLCVVVDRVFTQEQRGEQEAVVCFDLNTGAEQWAHLDHTRFEEALAGAGPRATPTFAHGKIYAMGAKGRLNCLDAMTGNLIWSRDAAAESSAPLPPWGFSSSPLVAGGLVSVITGGNNHSLVTYRAETGEPAWSAGNGWSYASPQLAKFDGVEQILLTTSEGVASFDPTSGAPLWQHVFKLSSGGNRAIQPTILNEDSLLLGAAFGVGTQRIHLTHADGKWKDETAWTSRSIKPYYNDLVVQHDELYGFDGSIVTCVSAATGKPHWRKDGYGNGQVLLLADQNLLLILSEKGEAGLVDAKPDSYHEIGRFQALNGKTWNHPVVAHGKLLVRNGEEVACYRVE